MVVVPCGNVKKKVPVVAKMMALAIAMVMVLAMSMTVFAGTTDPEPAPAAQAEPGEFTNGDFSQTAETTITATN